MNKLIYLIIIIVLSTKINAQLKIEGNVTDNKKEPIVGANIYLKGTYNGTISDSLGNFLLTGKAETGNVLIVSFIGFENVEQEIEDGKTSVKLNIVLHEISNNVEEVTITAGSFDASDEAKAVTLRPLDIVTIASGEGDIYGALNTLPGTQPVGEDGGLFVRGGEGYEAKTYIDGMLVSSPYSSSMPDVPARGRFSPFLFSGTMFSTGGYSAEFGQALSSALVLKTNALPDKSVSSINLLSVGLGASHTKRWERTSLSVNVDYTNLTPYFRLAQQDIDWKKAPESLNGSILFRQKTGKEGMIKSFLSFSHERSRLNYPNIEYGGIQLIDLKNDNLYFNTVYNDMLSEKWQIMAGVSYNYDNERIGIDNDKVSTLQNTIQFRLKLTQTISDNLNIKYGLENINSVYEQDYFASTEVDTFHLSFNDTYLAAFVEPEIKLSKRFALRAGARVEYFTLNGETSLQPRVSFAYSLGNAGQFSFAYGTFNQAAQNDYRKFNNDLKAEQAVHYILNYQYVKKDRTFRVEAYYKDYSKLVKYYQLNNPDKGTYNNFGYGYAKGVDVFWRDRSSFKNIDYFISYSYVDTKRDYRNYPSMAAPMFTSEHNFSMVYKQWFDKISSQVGLTYSFSSGRPYFNPNNPDFMADRTPNTHDVSINFSYLTTIFGKSAIVHASVSNVLGFDKIYSYRYPLLPDNQQNYQSYTVKPGAKRFFLLVLMLSL